MPLASMPLAILLLMGLGFPAGSSGDEVPDAVARELLAKLDGDVGEADLERVEAALEWDFDHPALLEAAGRIALEVGDEDLAWWYGALAAEAADAAGDDATRDRMTEFIGELTPAGVDPNAVFEEYAKDLFKLAQNCKIKKLYANCAEVLLRCRGTRFERRAESLLESLTNKQAAVDAIYRTGIELPAKPATKKDPEWIAKYDTEHEAWEDVADISGKGYTIRTNMGYEMAHTLASTMEQMGEFYKDLFRIRKKLKPCTIKVYAQYDEMAANEEHASEGILGWFQPWDNVVVTFDPRSRDRPLAGLWETLFHEAAHQYTRAIASRVIPGWLSEGTACYFEGARLLPSGAVITNQVPEGRLRSLVQLFDHAADRWGLRGCVEYFEPGSYAGEYYPFGWGLTYYFFNYEDEDSKRIYVPIFRKYQELYTKEKSHDPFERFIEFFIEDAKVPGVTDFATFEAHWKQWIRELHGVYFGDESQADVLFARAQRQLENKQPEYAIESLRWAVDKRPNDIHLRMAYADALVDADQEDGATYSYRRALELARNFEGAKVPGLDLAPSAVAELAIERLMKISKNVGGVLAQSDAELLEGITRVAASFAEGGLPRSALHLVQTTSQLLNGHRELDQLAGELIATHELATSRRRRLRVDEELSMWLGDEGFEMSAENRLRALGGEEQGILTSAYRAEPRGPYRFEATIEIESMEEAFGVGLTFGSTPETGERFLLMLPRGGKSLVLAFGNEGIERRGSIDKCPRFEVDETYRLALEVDGANLKVFVDDEELGAIELPTADETRGRVGVAVQRGTVVFSDFVLSY